MFTRSRFRAAVGGAMFVLLLSACAGTPAATTAPATSAPASSPTATAPTSDGADATALALRMADSSLGSILVDGNGMTLYLFTNDSPNTSACEEDCLMAWPPLIGEPTAGEGVDDSKLGSFQRSDGRTQATYNGWPLYYWEQDANPGDVTGQNVNEVWFVIDRDGNAVTQ